MESLITGIFQYLQCRKIIKEKDKKDEAEDKSNIEMGDFYEEEYFLKKASLNKKYSYSLESYELILNNIQVKLKDNLSNYQVFLCL